MLPVLMVLVFAIVLLRAGPRWRPHRARENGAAQESARDILDRRYANGEITRQEYEEMRGVLFQRGGTRLQ
jgi:uncharacterized membrane protein